MLGLGRCTCSKLESSNLCRTPTDPPFKLRPGVTNLDRLIQVYDRLGDVSSLGCVCRGGAKLRTMLWLAEASYCAVQPLVAKHYYCLR